MKIIKTLCIILLLSFTLTSIGYQLDDDTVNPDRTIVIKEFTALSFLLFISFSFLYFGLTFILKAIRMLSRKEPNIKK